jgi:hypothetical protein
MNDADKIKDMREDHPFIFHKSLRETMIYSHRDSGDLYAISGYFVHLENEFHISMSADDMEYYRVRAGVYEDKDDTVLTITDSKGNLKECVRGEKGVASE